jgi:hypothetical protein
MNAPRSRPALAAAATTFVTAALLLAACIPDPAVPVLPSADLKPPLVLEAGLEGARSFLLRFDEEVRPVAGSYGLEPGSRAATAEAVGSLLRLDLGEELEPGLDYTISGEAEDGVGNATRFVFRFAGWNGNPARLVLSEAQTAKNSSVTRPHRDYLELLVLAAGNLGGEEISWASSVKRCSYRFPGVAVGSGERIVLHLAPEGLPSERDETGEDLGVSGGADATATGRDFWCSAGGLPDANGAVMLRPRPGEKPEDALFYAEESKSGPLGDDRLSALVAEMGDAWPIAGASPAWEDAFRWKPSTARSICRAADDGSPGSGAESWYLGLAGAQTPGSPNAPPAE